jgi:hypothetical protein
MLTIEYPLGSAIVRNGCVLSPFYGPPSGGVYDSRGIVGYYDPFINSWAPRMWYLRMGDRSVASFFRFTESQSSGKGQMSLSYPPDETQLGGGYDLATYGSIYRKGAQVLTGVLMGNSAASPRPTRENFVRHANYNGTLDATGTVDLRWEEVEEQFYDTTMLYRRISYPYRKGTVTSLAPLNVAMDTRTPGNQVLFDLLDYAQNVFSLGVVPIRWNQHGIVGGTMTSEISGGSITTSYDGSLSISYHVDVILVGPNSRTWSFDVQLTAGPITQPETFVPTIGVSYYPPQPNRLCTYQYSNFQVVGGSEFSTPLSNSATQSSSDCVALTQTWNPTVDAVGLWAAERVLSRLRYNVPIESFRNAVHFAWGDITPSACNSTVAAFSQLTDYVGSNVLQTLWKVPEIGKALPDIKSAISILGKIWKRDLSFATIREILNLSSKTVLQANFTWRPYHSLLSEGLGKIAEIYGALKEPRRLTVAYGSFEHVILNDLGRPEVHLRTRTKIVVDITPTGVLASTLAFDASGLLPRVSRVWDLIPFTFVVNWLTGIGAHLNRLETSAFLCTVPAYYVHTYELTTPFTTEELEYLGASDIGATAAEIKIFNRDVSIFAPMPLYSRFGFGMPTGSPSWAVVGSLFYQLFLSR